LQEHKTRFYFPERPLISDKCKDLISRLIEEKEYRLSCRLYHQKDRAAMVAAASSSCTVTFGTSAAAATVGVDGYRPSVSASGSAGGSMHGGQYVFPNDGEDIKAHRWFRNMP
jgi:hypothetical protein